MDAFVGIFIGLFLAFGWNFFLVSGDTSKLSSRKWIFTDGNKIYNSLNKTENIIWIISKFQVWSIFIYCLIIGVRLIFSKEGETLYSLSPIYFLFLLITILVSVNSVVKNLFVDSKKYTFLNYKEDYRITSFSSYEAERIANDQKNTFFLFLSGLVLFIVLFINAVFYENSFRLFGIIPYICLGVDGFYETGIVLVGLWLTWGLIFANSKIKSKLNTEPIIFELLSEPVDYFISGGKINMLIHYPEPQNSVSIIFKEGQELNVLFYKNPSNAKESETILITDSKEQDFIVTKIEDKHLPYFLRKKEYELKAELKSIIGSKKLEIALWIERIEKNNK
jgi:hypothetical protein